MKTITKLIAAATLLFSTVALGHANLEKSSPSNNQMLMSSPEQLALTFSKEVRVVKVKLTNKEGKNIKFGFKPVAKESTEFSWPLPKLNPETYTVEVMFLGKDGHMINEQFGFMVH